jgi:hypothetical protein
MYTIETVESLQAYASRLHRDRARTGTSALPPRRAVRDLVRKVRRTA